MQKHEEEILEKTHRTSEEFEKLLQILERRILLIPLDELKPHMTRAKTISPDPKDIAYVALALRNKIPVWSNDKPLKERQQVVIVYNTTEVLKLFKGLSD